ncbi:D-beta-hydroxybutyrate dehydrogenase-like [Saccoglossus kowalevskii]|uniref:3-oxoacyl-[acyl-carrier-protein] reductase n=1 Tax=Saccoglossus kowalevskii TaxID=10224 RepID=A0ABM0MUF9_SACKO|nr:PREDICTED: tropinone reductase homolog At1g07440-like [Saccoglossus kowalevskii]
MIRAEIEQLCKSIEEIHPGGVDVLVNNAGRGGTAATIEQYPVANWDDVIKVNLTAPFDLIRLSIGEMKKRGWGRIINISSIFGKKTITLYPAYVCSKHGLNGLTKTVANDTFGTGVTCNAICPAVVETQLAIAEFRQLAETTGLTYETVTKQFLEKTNPNGQFIKSEQIAELAAFLCSPCADQMTGAIIPIDGGSWAT